MHAIQRFDAIVIAGGRGSRLGGVDKPALRIGELSLLERAVAAVGAARRISVVRHVDDVAIDARVSRTEERPARSGPASAIAAGLADLATPAWASRSSRPIRGRRFVAVLAADLPRAGEAFAALRRHRPHRRSDALIAVDPEGRDQPLLALYRTAALRSAIAAGPTDGLSMFRLIAGLTVTRVPLDPELCADIDVEADAVAAGIVLPRAGVVDV